jgi:hypothetical protein
MCPNLLGDARLYEMLLRCDEELAAAARAGGCPCGGVLHSARYPRKPRGAQGRLPEGYDRRGSFCCAAEGCRQRTTPASLRFLGRKVYLGAVVTLVTAMKHGVTARRAAELRRAIGVSRKTLARWRTWWTEVFVATSFWQTARALVSPPVAVGELPASLLCRFADAGSVEGLVRFLDFIKPVTTATAGGGERKTMGT